MGGAFNRKSGSDELIALSRRLGREAGSMTFTGKVSCVYNPLDYARGAHETYLSRYGGRDGVALLLGMNPGPWGMAQTGVPFGEVGMVRDWLDIRSGVERPQKEHPKRPILGFDCHRSEVSGARLWGWARERFGTPDAFFDRFFVWNYCPLSFMVETGANYTPDKLPKLERERLFDICDRALRDAVRALRPKMVVGIGKFAQDRARRVLGDTAPIGVVLHPSPASPAANRGWAKQAEEQLAALGLLP